MKDKLTWHETVKYIRTLPDYKVLVEKAYFEEDLSLNVDRFRNDMEYRETLRLIQKYKSEPKSILDIGSGNGVSAISFALDGFEVTTIEPNPSNTVGAEAIRRLKEHYRLSNIAIYQAFAEEIGFADNQFDIVYARQCMHHAYDLGKFVHEMARVLKKGGLFITVRDHVIFDEQDKNWFLESHPLQKFYGGENAFTPEQYREAIKNAGLVLEKELKHYDSPINYFPATKEELTANAEAKERQLKSRLRGKIGFLANVRIIKNWYYKRQGFSKNDIFDERKIPGRMYSYIATKP